MTVGYSDGHAGRLASVSRASKQAQQTILEPSQHSALKKDKGSG